jgi:hypothetical protein
MKIGLQIPRFDWPGSPENIGSRAREMIAENIKFYESVLKETE